MTDVYSLAWEDTTLRKESVKSLCGACPNYAQGKCNRGTDGFVIKWDAGKGTWIFSCRGCWDSQEIMDEETALKIGKRHKVGERRGWGDTIDYLRHFRGMSYREAKALAEGSETDASMYVPHTEKTYLTDKWQSATRERMKECVDLLWSEDTLALDYARSRGLTEATVKQFQLGYSRQGGIPRLLIPVFNDGHYATIYRRDLRNPRPENTPSWMSAADGTMDELYLADCLYRRVDVPVVLCEDAFSALSIWQECHDLVNVVATGSAGCGMKMRWIARLACMPLVLVALDADKAGDQHAQQWLSRLPNGRRLRPLLKDPNDMLMDGWDLRAWVEQAISEAREPMPVRISCIGGCGKVMDDDFHGDLFELVGIGNNGEEQFCCKDCLERQGAMEVA